MKLFIRITLKYLNFCWIVKESILIIFKLNWKVNFGWMILKNEMKEELLMEILLLKLLIFGVTFQINGSQHCVKKRMKKLLCISPLKPNNNKIVQLLLKKLIYYYYWIFLLVKIAFFFFEILTCFSFHYVCFQLRF